MARVALDVTQQARRGELEPVRCRDGEIARVIDILLRQGKNNPALVGRAGVGKTAIVEGLAQRIAAGDVPPALKDAQILSLDHIALLADTTFRGQYEGRLRRVVEALAANPDAILFVDELHNLIGQGTGQGAAMDAANMLKPALVRGDIRIIGATTGTEYDRWVRGDPALERRFHPVPVEELDAAETREVLLARRPRLERHHAVAISDDALQAAIVLTDRFRHRPGSSRQGHRRPGRSLRPRPGHGPRVPGAGASDPRPAPRREGHPPGQRESPDRRPRHRSQGRDRTDARADRRRARPDAGGTGAARDVG